MAGWPEHSPSSSGSSAPLPSHRRPPLPPPFSAENSVSTSSISFHRPFDSPPSACERGPPAPSPGGRTASKDISTCVTSRVTNHRSSIDRFHHLVARIKTHKSADGSHPLATLAAELR